MPADRVLTVSFLISLLVHLSMVTVFRIVVFFPREEIAYYSFSIVDEPRTRAAQPSDEPPSAETLQLPSADDGFYQEAALNESGPTVESPAWSNLPRIELPTLEFANLERLRLRQESLEVRDEYRRLLEPRPADSWARFTQELGNIGGALTRLAGTSPLRIGEDRPEPVGRPAEGFVTYLNWMSEPRDRKLRLAPPIQALWQLNPERLEEPITVVFTVDPKGKVIEVLTPQMDDSGVAIDASKAVAQYRFDPLDVGETMNQRGALIITAEGTTP